MTDNNVVTISDTDNDKTDKSEESTLTTSSIMDIFGGSKLNTEDEPLDADMLNARAKKRKFRFYEELDKLILRLSDSLNESKSTLSVQGKGKPVKNPVNIGLTMFKSMLEMRNDPELEDDIISDLYAIFDIVYEDYKTNIVNEKPDQLGMWLMNNKVIIRYGSGCNKQPSKIALFLSFIYVTAIQKCNQKKQELDLKTVSQEEYANHVELIRPYTILLHLYRIFCILYPKDHGIKHKVNLIEVYLGIQDPKVLEQKSIQPNFMGDMIENTMKEFGINIKLSDIQTQLKTVMSDPQTKADVKDLAQSM